MNCDRVFDVLTRGPFPTGGAADHEVEGHLLDCADCRQLAEALRPALELFEEAVTLEESRTLPGYWGNLHTGSESRIAVAQPIREPRKLSDRLLPSRLLSVAAEHATQVDWWRLAAAVLLGVLLGSWFRSAIVGENQFASGRNRSAKPDLQLLASMSLPTACRNNNQAPLISTADMGEPQLSIGAIPNEYACCTKCHNASASPPVRKATSQVAMSCQACH
jgi:hypothetical protein